MKRRPWWPIGKGFPGGNPGAGRDSGEQTNGPHLVDAHEMARILQVSVRWLYRRVQLKEIPHVKVGKYVRFEPQKVIQHYQKSSEEAGVHT